MSIFHISFNFHENICCVTYKCASYDSFNLTTLGYANSNNFKVILRDQLHSFQIIQMDFGFIKIIRSGISYDVTYSNSKLVL